jgi:hypothetical protein
MKCPHSIPLCRTNGEPLSGNAPCRIVLSSAGIKWNDVVVEQQHCASDELPDVTFKRHVIAINIGHSITWEFKKLTKLLLTLIAESPSVADGLYQPFQ